MLFRGFASCGQTVIFLSQNPVSVQMSDVWRLVHLARIARRGGYPLRMPSDFPRTLRVALFRATTAACVDALDHDARWERFSLTFNMCAASPSVLLQCTIAADLAQCRWCWPSHYGAKP